MVERGSPEGSSSLMVGVAVLAMAGLLLLALTLGGQSSGESVKLPSATSIATGSGPQADQASAAKALLERMITRYRTASAYADEATLTLRYQQDGRPTEQSWPAAVQFIRPGRVKVKAFQLTVASDAASSEPRWLARIRDPETNDLDGQVLSVPAPKQVLLEHFARDGMLAEQMGSRLQRPPVQLELLLSEQPLAALFTGSLTFALLEPQSHSGARCQRIEAKDSSGSFIFWIDEATELLRKLEYPAAQVLPELAADPSVTNVALVCDLASATWQPKLGDLDFSLPLPEQPHFMQRFLAPPRLSDTQLLGKEVRPFEFVMAGGEKITQESLRGKTVALFWYAHHPVCAAPAKAFADLAARFAEHDQLAFLAVCTEPPEVGDRAVKQQLAQWQVDFPASRDLHEQRSSVFALGELPAVVLIDSQGRYQSLLLGAEGIAVLPQAMERLSRGANLAGEALQRVAAIRAQYEQLLKSGGEVAGSTGQEKVAPPSPPQKLKLTPAWHAKDLPEPAGMCIRGETLLALANEQEVWEYNAAGEVLARHRLVLPEGTRCDSLRAAQLQEKWYYAAFSLMKSGVFLFDEAWQPLGTYHAEPDTLASVSDVEFAPWGEQNEPLLLIAHADSLGLHAVNLRGEVVWRNRTYLPATSVCLSPPDDIRGSVALLAGKDAVGQVNRYGHEDPEHPVAGWSFRELQLGSADAQQAVYGALGRDLAGQRCLVGLSATLQESWNVPLPALEFAPQIDCLTHAARFAGPGGAWIVALPDGSVHVVSDDGTFNDAFRSGLPVRAVGVLPATPAPLLVLAADDGLHAFQVEFPTPKQQ
jgi:peroxiredoxin